MAETLWFLVLVAVLLVILIKVIPLKQITIYEYQKGLRYGRGRYIGTVDRGQYWIFPMFSSIVPVDTRPQFITIPGQDVLSADGVTLKVSLAAEYQVVDPNLAVNKNADFRSAFYLSLQVALREIVGKEKIEAVLENRAGISAKLVELTSQKTAELGLKLISVGIKDIMFAGEMKKAFAQVVKAQKEGQAALERARGESAALRNLANAAKIMDDNPNLLQLRALQALGDSSGNTMVWGVPNSVVPVAKGREKSAMPTRQGSENQGE
jgi:regulator of protease activity HflC (stomatin/prohibitin superfamily)